MKLEEILVEILKAKKYTVTTAESCTGGLVAATIVNATGASSVFNEGYITYSNESKYRLLGVSEKTLENEGAVSESTAKQMAEGCAKKANANIGLSTTGIAGPDGGTNEKPVGLVYIGCYVNGNATVSKNMFKGDRTEIRKSTVKKALEMAISELTL